MRMSSSYLFPHTDSKRPHKRKHDSQRTTQPTSMQCAERAANRFYLANEERKRRIISNNVGKIQKKNRPMKGQLWKITSNNLGNAGFSQIYRIHLLTNSYLVIDISSQTLDKNKRFTEITLKKSNFLLIWNKRWGNEREEIYLNFPVLGVLLFPKNNKNKKTPYWKNIKQNVISAKHLQMVL